MESTETLSSSSFQACNPAPALGPGPGLGPNTHCLEPLTFQTQAPFLQDGLREDKVARCLYVTSSMSLTFTEPQFSHL